MWTVVAAIGISDYTAGSALESKHHEFSADKFGMEVAAHSGMGMAKAENAALTVLQRHIDDPEDAWLQCAVPNPKVHPAPQARVDRL